MSKIYQQDGRCFTTEEKQFGRFFILDFARYLLKMLFGYDLAFEFSGQNFLKNRAGISRDGGNLKQTIFI